MVRKYFLIVSSIFILAPGLALANKGAVTVDPSEVFEATGSDGKSYTCAPVESDYLSGKQSKKDATLFTTWKVLAQNKKKAARKKSGSKKVKLKKSSKKLKKKGKIGDAACAAGPGGGGGGGGETELCDSEGNVTEAGKTQYGIPSNLSASISGGSSVYEANCVGCHTEYRNRTFTELREEIAKSPMLFDSTDIPDEALANITVYLNRFTCF